MTLESFVLYFFLGDRLIPMGVAIPVDVAIWAIFAIILGGLVTELAEKAGFRWPLAYGIATALAPPVGLPIFLLLRGRIAFDHRGLCVRRRGYGWAIVAFVILVILEFVFIPDSGPAYRPHPAVFSF